MAASASPRVVAQAGPMGWLVTCLLALPVLAQPELGSGRIARDEGASTLSVSESRAEPLATAGPTLALGAGSEASRTAQQTMLWRQGRQSLLGLGIGVEQRGPYIGSHRSAPPQAAQPAGVLLGLSLETGPQSRLTLQTPLLNAPRPPMDELLMPQEEHPLRLGLVFHSGSSPYADWRRGVRIELSGQTTLSFKPRSGRVGVTLQSRW